MGSCRCSCAAWEGCYCHIVKQLVSPVSGCLRGKPHCRPVLDEKNLPEVTACGLNMPCPDLLTPQRAAGAIWTWAPGQPYDADWSQEWQAGWMQYLLQLWQPLHRMLGLQVRIDSSHCRGRCATSLHGQLAAAAAAALAVCMSSSDLEIWFLYFAAGMSHITLQEHVIVPVVKAVKNLKANTL